MTRQDGNVIQLQIYTPTTGGFVQLLYSAHEITITRPVFDLGTLEAVLLDPSLDPSLEGLDSLVPGRDVVLNAYTGGKWETLFTGKLRTVETTYTRAKTTGAPLRPSVHIVAVDAFAKTAIRENRTVLRVAELPHLFAGKDLMFDCNGVKTGITAPPTIDLRDDNKTLADQVALTRDTNLGYAWVNRKGEFVVRDGALMPVPEFKFGNPNLNSTTQYWSGYNGATIARDTGLYKSGPASLKITAPAGGGISGAYATTGDEHAVAAGQKLTVGAWWYASVARSVRVTVEFHSMSGGTTGTASTVTAVPAGTWTKVEHTSTAPAGGGGGTATAAVRFQAEGCNAAEVHNIDDAYGLFTNLPAFTDQPGAGYPYSVFEAGYDTDSIMNRIWVNVLRPQAGADTTEALYGPFLDAPSIDLYGPHSVTYTILDDPARTQAAYATVIRRQNANPKPRCHTLRMPVRNDTERGAATLLDLYDLVLVTLTGKLSARGQYITEIVHNITPDKWTVDYSFDTPNTVAPPAAGPTQAGG